MDDAGDRGASAILDVGCSTCNSSGCRNSAEKWSNYIGDTLSNEFGVAAVVAGAVVLIGRLGIR